MKKMFMKFGTTIAAFSMMIAVMESNEVCAFIIGQPELPESVKSLRKF